MEIYRSEPLSVLTVKLWGSNAQHDGVENSQRNLKANLPNRVCSTWSVT